MYCKCHKVNFKRGGSYIDSPDWIKSFQYAATVALNYEEIKWNPEKVSNIKPLE